MIRQTAREKAATQGNYGECADYESDGTIGSTQIVPYVGRELRKNRAES